VSNPFVTPSSGASDFDLNQNLGRLIVIEPRNFEPQIRTSNGPKDAVRAAVSVIDINPPETHDDILLFPTVIVNQLKNELGKMVLGRLIRGQAKPGQQAPWKLEPASEQDVQHATQWLQWRNSNQFQTPTQQPQQPAQAYQPTQQPIYQAPPSVTSSEPAWNPAPPRMGLGYEPQPLAANAAAVQQRQQEANPWAQPTQPQPEPQPQLSYEDQPPF